MFFAIKESSVAAFIEKTRFRLPLEVNDQFLLLIKAVFMVRILLLVACLCLAVSVSAQSLSGVVKDKASDEVLISATVKLVPENGSALFTTTDLSGQFYFNKLKSGTYVLNISYVGYKAFMETVKIANTSNKINVYIQENSQLLGEVAVTGRATRAEQRGDSLMYNAEAFKVMQGSSAEDLLAKMPGVVVEGGTVQAQGEQVEKILVDGKEFFEGDVSLAVKNLPSDIIASIEIFDKKSDQSEFTGFDDGEEVKTINIVTKTGFRQGTFGEMTAGYGTDERYKVNGNLNFFNENQRISVLGMSNNVNQQNFSQEDLTGILSSNSGNKRKGFRNGGGKKGYQSGSSVADFMIGSMDGLTSTNGLGLNYVDQWGKKLKITSSYFFNKSDNQTLQQTNRNYLDAALAGMSYEEYKENYLTNWNHRFNFKLDYQINERSSLLFRPSLSFQNMDSNNSLQGTNKTDGALSNETSTTAVGENKAYNIGADLLFRHRFTKPGRTLSWMLSGRMSNTDGSNRSDFTDLLYSSLEQNIPEEHSQLKNNIKKQYSFRSNLTFTEKISDELQLQLGYKLNYSDSENGQKTFVSRPDEESYEQLDENLSSMYRSDYLTQSGNVGIRYQSDRWNAMLRLETQWANLKGDLTYPQSEHHSRSYFSVLPSLMFHYVLDQTNSLQFRYRSITSSPSITDLQSVVNNSNPLFLFAGNPYLDQELSHIANLRYIHTTKSGHTFIAMLGATYKQKYIGDSTFVANENIELVPSVTLNKGAQFTRPINLNGYYSLQSMLTYGFPLDLIRSNINVSVAANYTNTPTVFNGVTSDTRELNLIPKIIIGSNINKNIDFTTSYSAAINNIFSSSDEATSNDYITHTASVKLGCMFFWGLTLRSTFNYVGYTGLDTGTEDYCLWNLSLGKKFLKNNAAEIKLEAFDVLKQNRNFTHRLESNYCDYISSNVLEPYMMLSLTYTIR